MTEAGITSHSLSTALYRKLRTVERNVEEMTEICSFVRFIDWSKCFYYLVQWHRVFLNGTLVLASEGTLQNTLQTLFKLFFYLPAISKCPFLFQAYYGFSLSCQSRIGPLYSRINGLSKYTMFLKNKFEKKLEQWLSKVTYSTSKRLYVIILLYWYLWSWLE